MLLTRFGDSSGSFPPPQSTKPIEQRKPRHRLPAPFRFPITMRMVIEKSIAFVIKGWSYNRVWPGGTMGYRYTHRHATADIRQAVHHVEEVSLALSHTEDRQVQAHAAELRVAADRIKSSLEVIESSVDQVKRYGDSAKSLLSQIK